MRILVKDLIDNGMIWEDKLIIYNIDTGEEVTVGDRDDITEYLDLEVCTFQPKNNVLCLNCVKIPPWER